MLPICCSTISSTLYLQCAVLLHTCILNMMIMMMIISSTLWILWKMWSKRKSKIRWKLWRPATSYGRLTPPKLDWSSGKTFTYCNRHNVIYCRRKYILLLLWNWYYWKKELYQIPLHVFKIMKLVFSMCLHLLFILLIF